MCETKTSREEVDDNLIDVHQLLNNIVLRTFNISLPPAIKQVFEKASKPDDKERPSSKCQKVDRNRDNPSSEKLDNHGKIDKWILDHDKYSSSLRHLDALRTRPKIEGTPVCHRFHSKGYCFDNCANKSTHTNSSELPAETKKDYEKWLKTVSSNQ